MSALNDSPAPFDHPRRDLAGTQAHAVDRELALLLDHTYDLAAQRRDPAAPLAALPPGWQRISDQQLAAAGIDASLLSESKSGFDAALYRNSDGLVALALNGTDQARDWKSNLRQGIGLDDVQYDQAVALARQAKAAFGDDLVISGHSLGGGLAATAAMVTDTPAVTFNAAGVHDTTLQRYGYDAQVLKHEAAQGQVRNYQVKNELLTYLQEDNLLTRWVMPDAAGHRIELPDPDPKNFFERMVPGVMLKHRLDLHGIDAVLQAQQQAGLQVRGQPSAAADTRLLHDATRGLAPQREALGLDDTQRFFNTASHMAAKAGDDGLQRIDHVVATPGRDRLVAVQGAMDDPGHRRSIVDAAQAAQEPASLSAGRLQQGSEDQQQRAQEQEQVAAQRRSAVPG
jgi:hypothetical protein